MAACLTGPLWLRPFGCGAASQGLLHLHDTVGLSGFRGPEGCAYPRQPPSHAWRRCRRQLFNNINSLPTVYEIVSGRAANTNTPNAAAAQVAKRASSSQPAVHAAAAAAHGGMPAPGGYGAPDHQQPAPKRPRPVRAGVLLPSSPGWCGLVLLCGATRQWLLVRAIQAARESMPGRACTHPITGVALLHQKCST